MTPISAKKYTTVCTNTPAKLGQPSTLDKLLPNILPTSEYNIGLDTRKKIKVP